MISVDNDIGSISQRDHFALVPSHRFTFAPALRESRERFGRDWEQLELDPYMADGGSYRWRRYGLFRLSAVTGQLVHMPDASFFQTTETNPLNGGEPRDFAPLRAETVNNPFLRALIACDFAQLTSKKDRGDEWLIGVHQIRIVATPEVAGDPTPEGIHRDDETYTAQHLIERHNIDGGCNFFFGAGKEPTRRPQATWQQESFFDSYYFDRSVWHSVSPIVSGELGGEGHRDVLLLDFTDSSQAS